MLSALIIVYFSNKVSYDYEAYQKIILNLNKQIFLPTLQHYVTYYCLLHFNQLQTDGLVDGRGIVYQPLASSTFKSRKKRKKISSYRSIFGRRNSLPFFICFIFIIFFINFFIWGIYLLWWKGPIYVLSFKIFLWKPELTWSHFTGVWTAYVCWCSH